MRKVGIEEMVKADQYTYKLPVKVRGYTCNLLLNINPTCNCQVMSIGHMDYLFGMSDSVKELKECLLRALSPYPTKPLIILDVQQYYAEAVKEIAKRIVCEQPYRSTNGTDMILYLIEL